ncbi:hypothetical protein DMA11_07860 [Marinilabiliaceae bacterium JC017]|nr:hypothetical protein DMA11_07860 [Marinilabiliaceae bacterium JC017]
MKNKRKQEIENYLKEVRICNHAMLKALHRDDAISETMSLEQMQSALKVVAALHKELQRLRGS